MQQVSSLMLGAALIGLAASAPIAGRVATAPATLTFHDRSVETAGVRDRITSDGLGTYGDGIGGVSCVVFIGSTGDAHCDLSSSRNPVRVVDYDPSQRISGTGPTTPFSSNGSVNFEALAQMRNGESKLTTAVFATALGQFQLVNRLNPQTSAVSVTRADDHTWEVTTSDPYQLGAGDIAQFIQTSKANKTANAGLYHMPFAVTVTCPTCVSAQ
jgi:hypothetical protein